MPHQQERNASLGTSGRAGSSQPKAVVTRTASSTTLHTRSGQNGTHGCNYRKLCKYLVPAGFVFCVFGAIMTFTFPISWLSVKHMPMVLPPPAEVHKDGGTAAANTQMDNARTTSTADIETSYKFQSLLLQKLAEIKDFIVGNKPNFDSNNISTNVASTSSGRTASSSLPTSSTSLPSSSLLSSISLLLPSSSSLSMSSGTTKQQQQQQQHQTKSGKIIVYECTTYRCGGLADRQKGIINAYVLASLLSRQFKVHFTTPCNLENFLQPNVVDWTYSVADMASKSIQRISHLDATDRSFWRSLSSIVDLDAAFPRNVTVITSNMEGVQFLRHHPLASRVTWMAGKSVEEIWRQALQDLFKPKSAVQDQVNRIKAAIPQGREFVCAHMRIGKADAAIQNDVRVFHRLSDFGVLTSFLSRYNDSQHYRLFVASDSLQIIKQTRVQFPTVMLPSVPGVLGHIDKSPACDALKKALIEQEILGSCDVLVISKSGFSKVAAFRRGRDDNLFMFKNTITPCKREVAYLNISDW